MAKANKRGKRAPPSKQQKKEAAVKQEQQQYVQRTRADSIRPWNTLPPDQQRKMRNAHANVSNADWEDVFNGAQNYKWGNMAVREYHGIKEGGKVSGTLGGGLTALEFWKLREMNIRIERVLSKFKVVDGKLS